LTLVALVLEAVGLGPVAAAVPAMSISRVMIGLSVRFVVLRLTGASGPSSFLLDAVGLGPFAASCPAGSI